MALELKSDLSSDRDEVGQGWLKTCQKAAGNLAKGLRDSRSALVGEQGCPSS
jgi:hypothetical protein